MAIGGFHNYKGNNSINGNGGNSNSNRASSRRSYGIMILVSFGAALMGVMILHKLRERRMYNLIVQQKDTDFYSLHLILQKERDYNQEVTRKSEEMKAKIYSLRTQKMELERRVLEMQSTIGSLKDELKTMEVAFEEKQNEIKTLRAKQEDDSVSPQFVALLESLKQKEAEIAGLERRLDDHAGSSFLENVTMEGQKGNSGDEDGEKRVDQDENNGNQVGNNDGRGMIGKRVERLENVKYQSVENVKNEEAKYGNGSSASEENLVGNSTKNDIDDEGSKERANGQLGEHEDHQREGDEDRNTAKGGKVGANGVLSMAREKRGFVSNSKGKRWISIAKSMRLENNGRSNGVSRKRSMRFDKNGRYGLTNRVKKATFNREVPRYTDPLKSDSSENKFVSYSIVDALDQKAENRESKDREDIGIRPEVSQKEMSNNIKYNNEQSEGLTATDAEELEKQHSDDDKSGFNLEKKNEDYKE